MVTGRPEVLFSIIKVGDGEEGEKLAAERALGGGSGRRVRGIALGILGVPLPSIANGCEQGVAWLPVEGLPHFLIGGFEGGWIARTALAGFGGDGFAGDLTASGDNFADRAPLLRSQIEIALDVSLDSEAMNGGQILDVNVVAHCGANGGRKVVSKDGDLFLLTQGNLEHVGNEVGFDVVIFAQSEAGTSGIEVAKSDLLKAMEVGKPVKHFLEHQLGFAIGIDGLLRLVLGDGSVGLRDSIGGAGGGEDDFFHSGGKHGFEKAESPGDIVAKVALRLGHGFADKSNGGEVDNGFGPLLFHRLGEFRGLGDIGFEKSGSGIDGLAVAFAEVVDDKDFVPGIAEFGDAMGPM